MLVLVVKAQWHSQQEGWLDQWDCIAHRRKDTLYQDIISNNKWCCSSYNDSFPNVLLLNGNTTNGRWNTQAQQWAHGPNTQVSARCHLWRAVGIQSNRSFTLQSQWWRSNHLSPGLLFWEWTLYQKGTSQHFPFCSLPRHWARVTCKLLPATSRQQGNKQLSTSITLVASHESSYETEGILTGNWKAFLFMLNLLYLRPIFHDLKCAM